MSRPIRIDSEVARRLAALRRPGECDCSDVIRRLLDRCAGDYPLPDTRTDAS